MTAIAAYDFCKPGKLAGDRENRLAGWLRGACALATRTWVKRLPFQAEWSYFQHETCDPQVGLGRLPETAVAYLLGLGGGKVTTLMAMPRPLLLALSAALVGDAQTNLPADRDLTVVEESLFEFFVNHYVLPPLHETWPGPEPARLELLQPEPNPRWSRLFSGHLPVVVCTFVLTGPFGVAEWFWLWPREGLLVLLDQPDPNAAKGADAAARPRLDAVVNQLPVEVTVNLGSVDIRLSQVAGLRAGDVVVLNQRVSEPLVAAIGARKKYRGWPGRVGSAQAFKIESILDR